MHETEEGVGGVEESEWVRDSLFMFSGVYSSIGNGEFIYYGERPGPDWYGHGYFAKTLTVLRDGQVQIIRLHKHRWKNTITGTTVHSRPDDDPILVRYCTLIVFLRVFAWISSPVGFHGRSEFFESLETDCGSDRTVQRWTARLLDNAMLIQQAIRLSIIEESEPRPVESLFVGGLSPPDAVLEKRWLLPDQHILLWRGYAMLLLASRELAKHASYLLAGARRRWPKAEKTFGL
jgi:hypothetical protein